MYLYPACSLLHSLMLPFGYIIAAPMQISYGWSVALRNKDEKMLCVQYGNSSTGCYTAYPGLAVLNYGVLEKRGGEVLGCWELAQAVFTYCCVWVHYSFIFAGVC